MLRPPAIKTYGVTPLNEECGTIEWVDNLKPLRDIILQLYRQRNVRIDVSFAPYPFELWLSVQSIQKSGFFWLRLLRHLVMCIYLPIKYFQSKEQLRRRNWFKITNHHRFRPVLHEWFIETFPGPEAWYSARLMFTRTSAVMSIVGHVLGLVKKPYIQLLWH